LISRHPIWRSGDSPGDSPGDSTEGSAGGDDRFDNESGIALMVVIASLVLVLALASALVLTSLVETRIAAVSRDDALALSGAEAAASRALVDLRTADWDAVLGGALSTFSDGPPTGTRDLGDGTTLDLDSETADMQCGRPGGCSEADITSIDDERPWGPHNPRWRLYAYGPLATLLPGDPSPPRVYLATWVADDPLESDEDPLRDGDSDDNPGRSVLMVSGRAYGPGGSRRTVQLVVERAGADLRVLAHHERHP